MALLVLWVDVAQGTAALAMMATGTVTTATALAGETASSPFRSTFSIRFSQIATCRLGTTTLAYRLM